MTSKIKSHRRNKAVAAEDDTYRHSVPVIPQNNCQSSTVCNEYQLNLRGSDLTHLPALTSRIRQPHTTKQILYRQTIEERTSKKFLSAFTSLQQKIDQAKKQLNISKTSQSKEASFQLNSYKESSSGQCTPIAESMLSKLDQSTINLESNKQLINALKSKQKLIWSNKIKTYYLKEAVRGVHGVDERALEHLAISLEILKNRDRMHLPNKKELHRADVQLPLAHSDVDKKILVLDLDQTLFHCQETRNHEDDIQVDIPSDDGIFQKAYVSIRPYALSFLKKCRKNFEIIAFTASEQSYADAILDQFDPQRKYISHRLYRHHCVKLHNKVYSKDLSIINRDLSKIILVDNSPLSYLYQPENGIPILPYSSGEDCELLSLQKYLQRVLLQKDVRRLNRSTFKLQQYVHYDDCEALVTDLYCQKLLEY